ncbi:hypothetical protein SAMN05421858_2846 [Haladaptatus litoreus]|uniref:Uncharacterized protein n=1 Tax=Haladaptatus litoreus TaxID=553468 RepID=A0A1N7BYS9_9EURY|nr:hypothetical protein SAMN05421858_2846 [Haladaptatus litoreus]
MSTPTKIVIGTVGLTALAAVAVILNLWFVA